jgi:uncharacterized protein YcbK (DUF882 family)
MFSGHDMKQVRVFDLKETPKTHSLSAHFRLGEFACKDGSDLVLVHSELVELLENIRTHFNKPITIHSAYRTTAHNAKVGGKPDSRHIRGMAADIEIKGVPHAEVAHYAEQLGCGGVGRYAGFTHVDVWGVGRRWKG